MFRSRFKTFFMWTFNGSKVTSIHFLFEWRIACSFYQKTIWTDVKFLDGSVFEKPNPNRILVFHTSIPITILLYNGLWFRCAPLPIKGFIVNFWEVIYLKKLIVTSHKTYMHRSKTNLLPSHHLLLWLPHLSSTTNKMIHSIRQSMSSVSLYYRLPTQHQDHSHDHLRRYNYGLRSLLVGSIAIMIYTHIRKHILF